MTMTTYERKCLFGAYSFRGREFIVGNMPAGRWQAGTETVATSTHLETGPVRKQRGRKAKCVLKPESSLPVIHFSQ